MRSFSAAGRGADKRAGRSELSARLVECRERVIDDAVLAHRVVSPRAYGQALLAAVLTLLAGAAAFPMAALPAGGSPSATSPPAVAVVTASAGWANPLDEIRVTSPYGPRKNPMDRRHRVAQHNGVDLAAPEGTPIHAPAGGTVTVATETYRPNTEWGTVVVIDHGQGIQTRYAHLGTLEVREGQKVERGDRIGTVGTTGRVTGPHLHLEVLDHGEPTDPASLLPDLER